MKGGSRTLALLLVSVVVASPALADPKQPTAKDKQLAGDLVKKAIARSGAGDHAAALELYKQAYTVIPNVVLLSNIGSELEQVGKLEEALHYFCTYLEQDAAGMNADYATSHARALQAQLGNTVDDDNVCAPARPEPPPPPPPDPGRRTQRKADSQTGGGAPGERVRTAPHGGSSTLRYAGLATGAAGLVGLAIGAYDGIRAKQISDEISNQDLTKPWPDDIQRREHRGQSYENLEIGFLIGGGVLTATGTVLYLLGRDGGSAERPSDRTTLRVIPTTNGFAVSGGF